MIALLVALSRPPAVLLVGDSITGQYGPAAAAALHHDGYDAVVRAYPGVGLLDRGPRIDAPAALRRDLGGRARVVVAEFSGDYGIVDPPLPGVALGSAAFFAAWHAAVDSFTRQATASGASLVWLLAPRPLRGDTTVSNRLATGYDQVQGHGVNVLDPSSAVARYDRSGSLYAPDGRHLSAAGAKLVADLVAHDVEQHHSRWRLRLDELAHSASARALAAVAVVAIAASLGLLALRPSRTRWGRVHRAPVPAPR